MNAALLKQLALAKEAGTKAMAKDFFAKTPGAGGPADGEAPADGAPPGGAPAAGMPPDGAQGGDMQTSAGDGGAPPHADGGGQGGVSPEELEELLQLLQAKGA